jgi:hypothetical protein
MSWLLNRIGLATFLLIVAVGSQVRPSAADDRVVFILLVQSPDENAKSGMISWSQRFGNNLGVLLADIPMTTSTVSGGRSNVVIRRVDVADPVPRSELESRWRSARSLHAVSAVAVQDGKITIIDNDIFLGELKGDLESGYIHVVQEITPQSYQVSRDAIAVVTLYALAIDLIKGLPPGGNQHAICATLEKANLYRNDLTEGLRQGLEPLLRAIQNNLEVRGCRGRS